MQAEDEYINDDEDTTDVSSLSSLDIDAENKRILIFLYKLNDAVARARKPVKIMRNVSAIDQYVRKAKGGPKKGFVIDMRVSFPLSTLKFLIKIVSE
jgi:hypothetical protein